VLLHHVILDAIGIAMLVQHQQHIANSWPKHSKAWEQSNQSHPLSSKFPRPYWYRNAGATPTTYCKILGQKNSKAWEQSNQSHPPSSNFSTQLLFPRLCCFSAQWRWMYVSG